MNRLTDPSDQLITDNNYNSNERMTDSFQMVHGDLRTQQYDEIINALEMDNSELKKQLRTSNELIALTCETLRSWQERSRKEQSALMQYFLQAKQTITAFKLAIAERDEHLEKLGTNLSSPLIKLKELQCSADNDIGSIRNIKRTQYDGSRASNDFYKTQEDIARLQISNSITNCKLVESNELNLIETLTERVANLETNLSKEKEEKLQLSDSLQYLRVQFDELLSECEFILDKESKTESTVNGLQKEVDSLTERLSPADLVMRDDLISRVEQLESQINVMRAQAETYRANIETEKRSRECMNVERLKLERQVELLTGLAEKCKAQHSSQGSNPCLNFNTSPPDVPQRGSTPSRTRSK